MFTATKLITDKYVVDTIHSIDYIDGSELTYPRPIIGSQMIPVITTKKTGSILRVNGWDIYNGIVRPGMDIIFKSQPRLRFMALADTTNDVDESDNVEFVTKVVNVDRYICPRCSNPYTLHPTDLSMVCLGCAISQIDEHVERRVRIFYETKSMEMVRNYAMMHLFDEVVVPNKLVESPEDYVGIFSHFLSGNGYSSRRNSDNFTVFSEYDQATLIEAITEDFSNSMRRSTLGMSFFEGKKLIEAYIRALHSEYMNQKLVPNYQVILSVASTEAEEMDSVTVEATEASALPEVDLELESEDLDEVDLR